MSEMNLENPYVDAICRKGNRVILEKTPAGYCLGTWDEDGPCCRISGYAHSAEDVSLLVPDRICEENLFCNGGHGCGIRKNTADADDSMLYFAVVETSAKLVAVPKEAILAATEGLPSSWAAEEIVQELLQAQYNAESIVLTPEDFKEVDFIELDSKIESEYSYLLDKKGDVQVVEL